MKTKFKKGDKVLLSEDMITSYIVLKSWIETYINHYDGKAVKFKVEKVILDNDRVYDAEHIMPFSRPIHALAVQIENLKRKTEKKKFWIFSEDYANHRLQNNH